MSPKDPDKIRTALVDVRKGYRLLALYQTRVLDLCRLISDRMGRQYYYADYHGGRPPIQSNPPFGSSFSSFVPMLHVSYLFLSPKALKNPNKIDAGEWLLEIRIISDSGCLTSSEEMQTQVSKFGELDKSETKLVLYAFKCTSDLKRNWWNAWDSTKWPKPGSVGTDNNSPLHVYAMQFDMADLMNRETVDEAVRKFSEAVNKKLDVKLPVDEQEDEQE